MADKHIIDGIEYETEPSYVDSKTGKPVYHAKNVPEQIRGPLKLTPMRERYFKVIDSMPHLTRLQRGSQCWNRWVKVYADRWIDRYEDEQAFHLHWRPMDDVDADWRELDFHPNRPAQDSNKASAFDISELNADQAAFPCKVDFSNARFLGGAWFSGAEFQGGAWFSEAAFQGDANFGEAAFQGSAWFSGAEFQGGAWFSGAEFQGGAWFSGAEFQGSAWFGEAAFQGDANFGEARFAKKVSIKLAVFFRGANFIECTFENGADFSSSQFLGQIGVSSARVKGHASFDHVWFGKNDETPKPMQYEQWDEYVRSKYDAIQLTPDSMTVPDFKGAIFEVAPNLGYTNVPDIPAPKWVWSWVKAKLFGRLLSRFWQQGVPVEGERPLYAIKDGDAAAKLRVLGELAARGHHHLAEKRFFRAELLARRGWEAKNGYEVAMINAFELFSKCGLSFWRPVGWLIRLMALCALAMLTSIQPHLANMHGDEWIVASLCVGIVFWQPRWGLIGIGLWFFLLYWQAGHWTFGGLSAHTLAQLSIYTGLNSLPVIGLASDGYAVASEYLFGKPDMVPLGVRVLAFFQNAVSAVFIFFGLLAIRNYFKLG